MSKRELEARGWALTEAQRKWLFSHYAIRPGKGFKSHGTHFAPVKNKRHIALCGTLVHKDSTPTAEERKHDCLVCADLAMTKAIRYGKEKS